MSLLKTKLKQNYHLRTIACYIGIPIAKRLFRRKMKKQLKIFILLYHKVAPTAVPYFGGAVHPKYFRRHVNMLASHYNVIALEDLSKFSHHSNGKDTAIITFDDGDYSVYQWAFPILKQFDLPATVFLATDFVGSQKLLWPDYLAWLLYAADSKKKDHSLKNFLEELAHDSLRDDFQRFFDSSGDQPARIESLRRLGSQLKHFSSDQQRDLFDSLVRLFRIHVPRRFFGAVVSWEHVREMAAAGIRFGAHTMSHCLLTLSRESDVLREVSGSKREIEDQLQQPVTTFAYPYGKAEDFNLETIDQVRRCGFEFACTAIRGDESLPIENRLALKRRAVDNMPCLIL